MTPLEQLIVSPFVTPAHPSSVMVQPAPLLESLVVSTTLSAVGMMLLNGTRTFARLSWAFSALQGWQRMARLGQRQPLLSRSSHAKRALT